MNNKSKIILAGIIAMCLLVAVLTLLLLISLMHQQSLGDNTKKGNTMTPGDVNLQNKSGFENITSTPSESCIACTTSAPIIHQGYHRHPSPAKPTCNLDVCRKMSKILKNYIDFDSNPCDNFYKFVCSKSTSDVIRQGSEDIRNGLMSTAAAMEAEFYSQLMHRIDQDILNLLDNGQAEWVKIAKTFYTSCRNFKLFPTNMMIPSLVSKLQPVYTKGQSPAYLLGYLRSHFNLNIILDLSYPLLTPGNCLEAKQSHHFISSSFNNLIKENSTDTTLAEFTRRVGKYSSILQELIGPLRLESPIDDFVNTVVLFEKNMATSIHRFQIKQSEIFRSKRLSFQDLLYESSENPDWDWSSYIHGIEKNSRIKLTDCLTIRNHHKLYDNLRHFEEQGERFIFHYTLIHVLKQLESDNARPIGAAFLEAISNSRTSVKNDVCIPATIKLFPGLRIWTMNEMVTDKMREQTKIIQEVLTSALIDLTTRSPLLKSIDKFILEKLRNITFKTVHPEKLLENGFLNQIYEKITLNENKYYDNLMQLLEVDSLIACSKESQTFNFPDYPFYNTKQNLVAIQAPMFQMPYSHPDLPFPFLLATVGQAMAHEIAHAFDNTGLHYKLQDTPIKKEQYGVKFEKLWNSTMRCIVKKYGMKNENMNSNLPITINENFADLLAISLTTTAMKIYKSKDTDYQLPELDISDNTLFFISLGKSAVYCPLGDLNEIDYSAKHSPSTKRLNKMIEGMSLFDQTFHCSTKRVLSSGGLTEKCF